MQLTGLVLETEMAYMKLQLLQPGLWCVFFPFFYTVA